jgi:acetyl esterase
VTVASGEIEGRLPWRLRALFAVAGASAVLGLAPSTEAVPGQPLEKRRRAGQTPAWIRGPIDPRATHEDHVADTAHGPLRIRLYRPAGVSGRLPLVVYLHGGGWITGTIETTDTICAAVAVQGEVCVASVDYRLAPEAPYPAALDDAEAATLWLCENSDRLHVDASSIAVAGDSAGGNLAAALTLRLRSSGRVRVRAQALLYPVLDATLSCPSMREFTGWGLRQRDMRVYRDAYAGRAELTDPELSPLLVADVDGLPPAFVVTAGLDCLRDEGHQYSERFVIAGVPVTYTHYPHLPHGFVSLAGLCPEAGEVLTDLAAFLRRNAGVLPPRGS